MDTKAKLIEQSDKAKFIEQIYIARINFEFPITSGIGWMTVESTFIVG